MNKIIKPIDHLSGEICLPGDKSISHRTVFLGSISEGRTEAQNFLEAEDCLHTAEAFRSMGIDVNIKDRRISVTGKGLTGLSSPKGSLYLGNSGTTMRLLPGILSGQNFKAVLTGDESLQKRPMKRIIAPLQKMGVNIKSKNSDDKPPLVITGGKVIPAEHSLLIATAQVKSCILFAGLFADGVTTVTEPFQSRDHTERLLSLFGGKLTRKNLTVSIKGRASLTGSKFFIPGDISSAAFFIGASCVLKGSELLIRDVGLNPTRLGFIDALLEMGANIRIENEKKSVEPYGDIRVKFALLKPIVVEKKNIPLLIDEIPILAVVASACDGKSVIKGVGELKFKETDRIASIIENLQKMGIKSAIEGEDLTIVGNPKRVNAANFESFGDHRTAMSMAMAALRSTGECEIKNTDCVNTSFPEFFEILEHLKR
ncbi:MAG: 3-phosphoshikimate 1-carboxyvinyltransferase [Candidatus Omnitrophota bacterium]